MSQGTLRGGFNPLFIGAWVRTGRIWQATNLEYLVSIPSSSGPGFGPCQKLEGGGVHQCFNPLFIGAWVRTIMLLRPTLMDSIIVSIPSSSGPGFGPIGEQNVCI